MDIVLFPSSEKNLISLKKIKSKNELSENKDKEYSGYLIESDEKEIRRIVETLKARKTHKGSALEEQNKIIAVAGRDDAFNRRIIETIKTDFLVSPEKYTEKDGLKQRDSGLNHVTAKAAAKNNISIVIDFSDVSNIANKKEKSIRLAKIMQNIVVCRKVNCPIKIASFAEDKTKIIDEYSLKAFLFSLGESSQQVGNATNFK